MIVGLSGYARAGKSEAASALVQDGWELVAFADKLREFLYILNPIVEGRMWISLQEVIDSHGWEGYKDTELSDEIRRLIQTVGTNCGRDLLGDNVWVDATLKSYDGMGKSDLIYWKRKERANWIVHDVRFPNEAEAIKNRGGKIIRISRPGVGPVNGHISETALDDYPWDHVIENDSTVESLHHKVRSILGN